jgi:hypothetical protein
MILHRHAWNFSQARFEFLTRTLPPSLWSGFGVGVLGFGVGFGGLGLVFGGGSGAEAPVVVIREDIEGHECLPR